MLSSLPWNGFHRTRPSASARISASAHISAVNRCCSATTWNRSSLAANRRWRTGWPALPPTGLHESLPCQPHLDDQVVQHEVDQRLLEFHPRQYGKILKHTPAGHAFRPDQRRLKLIAVLDLSKNCASPSSFPPFLPPSPSNGATFFGFHAAVSPPAQARSSPSRNIKPARDCR